MSFIRFSGGGSRTLRGAIVGGLMLVAALAAVACSDSGEVSVSAAWARATAGNPDENTAIYGVIENTTGEADTLVGVNLDKSIAAMAEVHEVVPQGDNMMMREIEGGLPIGDGETVTLKPGGFHVMVMRVAEQLNPGDTFGATFIFEQAGEVQVEVEVREAAATGSNKMEMGGS